MDVEGAEVWSGERNTVRIPFSNPASATVIALLGPQASSPAMSAKRALVATCAGEDACGPRRARPFVQCSY